MSKKQIKNWSDLKNYKETMPVYHGDKLIFEMQEMTDKEFGNLLQVINKGEQEIDVNSVKFLASALKKIVVGVNFDNLSDQEIIDELEQMGECVILEINRGLKKFVIDRIIRYGESLKSIAEDIQNTSTIEA